MEARCVWNSVHKEQFGVWLPGKGPRNMKKTRRKLEEKQRSTSYEKVVRRKGFVDRDEEI